MDFGPPKREADQPAQEAAKEAVEAITTAELKAPVATETTKEVASDSSIKQQAEEHTTAAQSSSTHGESAVPAATVQLAAPGEPEPEGDAKQQSPAEQKPSTEASTESQGQEESSGTAEEQPAEEEDEEELDWNVDLDSKPKEAGTRVYSKEFLLRFRELCLKAPKGMPTTDHILALLQDDGPTGDREDKGSWERSARGQPRAPAGGRSSVQTPAAAFPPGINGRGGPRTAQRSGSAPVGNPGVKLGKSGKPLVRWPIKKTLGKNEEVMKQCKGLLNKLTIENFDSISNKLLNAGITADLLADVINLIFEKALFEHKYSKMYADLCVMLANSNADWKDFKRLLLNRCQEEFERDPEAIKAEWEGLGEEERAEKDFLLRKRMKGNVKFIGELFKAHMLAMEIMYICADMLLQNPNPANLEAICKLFATVGKFLDVPEPKKQARLEGYFAKLASLAEDRSLESRIRFLLINLVDLRKNHWVPRLKEEKPVTIKEVHQQAKELEESQMRMNNQRRMGGSRGRHDRHDRHDRNDRDRNFGGSRGHRDGGRKTILHKGDRRDNKGGKFGSSGDGWKTVQSSRPTPTPAKLGSLQNPTSLKPSHSLTGVASPQTRPLVGSSKVQAKAAKAAKVGSSNPFSALSMAGSPQREPSPLTELPTGKVKSMLVEYYDQLDTEELMECLNELVIPNKLRPDLVGFVLHHAAEKNKSPAEVTDLVDHLVSENYLKMPYVGDGVPNVLRELEDMSEDMPVAPERVGKLLARLVGKKHLTLARVKSCIDEVSGIVDAGLAEKLLASLLSGVKDEVGEARMQELYNAAQLDITAVMSEGTRKSTARQQALLKKHNITCLNPMLEVSSCLSEHLAAGVEETTSWLNDSVSPNDRASEEFVRLLVVEVLAASVDKQTVENGKDVPSPVLLEHEKQELEKFAPLLLTFVPDMTAQLWTLLAVQQFCHKHSYPKGLLERLFNALFEHKVVEAEVFNNWLDNTHEDGKQPALFQMNEWFNWLNKEEEEEEEETDDAEAEAAEPTDAEEEGADEPVA